MLKRCFNFPLPILAAEAKKTQSKAPPVTGSNHNLILAEILREAESSTVKFYDTSVMDIKHRHSFAREGNSISQLANKNTHTLPRTWGPQKTNDIYRAFIPGQKCSCSWKAKAFMKVLYFKDGNHLHILVNDCGFFRACMHIGLLTLQDIALMTGLKNTELCKFDHLLNCLTLFKY